MSDDNSQNLLQVNGKPDQVKESVMLDSMELQWKNAKAIQQSMQSISHAAVDTVRTFILKTGGK